MRSRSSSYVLACCGALVALGCDQPTAVNPVREPVVAKPLPGPGLGNNPPCTHRWAAAVDGSWDDQTKWNVGAVPGSGSSVCIDVAGSYTVTLDPVSDVVPVDIAALTMGGASGTQTLRLYGADLTLNVAQGIEIGANGEILFNNFGGGHVNAATVVNAGLIKDVAQCGGCGLGDQLNADIDNQGKIEILGVLTVGKANVKFTNSGSIALRGTGLIIPTSTGSPTFAQNGGTVSAPTLAVLSMRAGTFTLKGGDIPPSAQSTLPVVQLDGAQLVFSAPVTGSQTIGIKATAGGTAIITGDNPAGTDLWIEGASNQSAGTVTWLGSPTNFGSVRVEQYFFFASHVTIAGPGVLTNNGTLSRRFASPAVVHWNADVRNGGTWDVMGDVAFDKPNGAYDNYGTMITQSSAILTVSGGATFTNHQPGTVKPQTQGANGGTLRLDGGHFAGTGFVDMAVSPKNGGTVDPGAPFGLLTAASYYNQDNSGSINIEVGGAVAGQNYDQFATTGQFTRSGGLNIVSVGSVGVCGQVLDVVTDGSPGGQAAFQTITGQSAGAGRAWRILVKPHVVRLVGFNPTAKIGIEPGGVAIAEGGPSAAYNVCLSSAPASSVTVTATPDVQVTVAPGSVVFTPANFDLPQAILVTAVDDAAIEGLHSGTVTHGAASADPNYTNVAVPSLTAQITDNDVAPNQGPVATNDAATTPEDTPVLINVLSNDTDPDNDALTVTAVTQPAKGTATINVAGTAVSYTPPANFNGSTSFTYTISDGHGHTAIATVAVTVTPVNDAPTAGNDAASTTSPAPVVVSVLANDADVDGDALSVAAVTQPATGSAAISGGGQTVTYTPPASFGGVATFDYTVSDGHGGSASATVTITVTAPASGNHNPSAFDDVFTASAVSGLPILVLANDSDSDGDPLTVISVGQAGRGAATVNPQGLTVGYTPQAGFVGADQFTYTISDGRGGTASATVRVKVIAARPYDLELDVDVVAPLRIGQIGRQNVTVQNSSLQTLGTSADAPASLVTITPAAGLALVSVSSKGVALTCQPASNGDVTCRVPMLRGVIPPTSYTFVVAYRAVQVGTWTPSYLLSPGGGDSNSSNNAGAIPIVVKP